MPLEPIGMWSLNKDMIDSVGDHIHATTTFEHAWATTGHTVIGGF